MKAIKLLTKVKTYVPSIYRALAKYACNLYRKCTSQVLKQNSLLSGNFILIKLTPTSKFLRLGFDLASGFHRAQSMKSRGQVDENSSGRRKWLEEKVKKGIPNIGIPLEIQTHDLKIGTKANLFDYVFNICCIPAFNPLRTMFYLRPSLHRMCTVPLPSLHQEKDGAGVLQVLRNYRETDYKGKRWLKESPNKIRTDGFAFFMIFMKIVLAKFGLAVRSVYGLFTNALLKWYQKGTGNVLESYQIGTKASSLATDLKATAGAAPYFNGRSVDQASVMRCICIDKAWIVLKTVSVYTLLTHYQRFIPASTILDLYAKGASFQTSIFKHLKFLSWVKMCFCFSSPVNRLKPPLNNMLSSIHDAVSVWVVYEFRKLMGISFNALKNIRTYSLLVLMFFNLLDCFLMELKSIRTYSLLVLMVSMFSLSAQTPRKDSGADGLSHLMALKPGDKIPDAVWNQTLELNYFDGKKKTIKFSDLKGKLIILDFWATWCPSCIEGFPHMQEVKNIRKDNIEVFLVNSIQTKDTHKRVNEVIKRYTDKYDYQADLPYIFGDTLFQKLFPHNTLPHVVWINKEGMLVANTYPNALTRENINAVLSNGNVNLHQKELRRDSEKSKISDHWLFNGCYGGSLFKTYEEGQSPSYGKYSFNEDHTSFQIVNLSFPVLLAMAFDKELKGIPWRHWVFDSEARFYNKREILATGYKNIFSYEMLVKGQVSKATVKQSFREDFKQFFGIDISVAEKPIDVWKIVPNAKIEEIKSRGGIPEVFTGDSKTEMKFRNIPLELLIDNLSLYFIRPLLLEENNQLRVDITIPRDFGDWDDHKRMSFLDSMGLELVPLNKSLLYARFSPNNVGEESGS